VLFAAGWAAGSIWDVCVFNGCGEQAGYKQAAIWAVVLSWLGLVLVVIVAAIAALGSAITGNREGP
jgi:hypothetical protein